MYHHILEAFTRRYDKPEVKVFAPGRANIIGEHTDYNDGYVMPFAISQGVWFMASCHDSDIFRIYAKDTDEYTEISLTTDDVSNQYGWEKYFRQVLSVIDPKPLKGADIVFGGDLPIGAGISSSSAITCGFIALLNELNHWQLSADQMINFASAAEVGTGVRGGIMDQFAIFRSEKNNAILLDCSNYSHEYIHLNMEGYYFCLVNTNVKHNLIHTDYNHRRHECEQALNILNHHYRPLSSLSGINSAELPEIRQWLEEKLFRRVSFVVEENERVMKAKAAFIQHDFVLLGKLLYQSHQGLTSQYEVSCPELDWLVDYTKDKDMFVGSRMMGGGFGGCTINLLKGKYDSILFENVRTAYNEKFGIIPDIIPVSSSDGISYH